MSKQIDPPGVHIVKQGEWISKLAKWYGIADWNRIWDHPQNAKLREERSSPDILYPGDRVFIPAIEIKEVPRDTDKHHKFRLKGGVINFRMTVYDSDKTPRPNVPYTFSVHPKPGTVVAGQTNGDGKIEQRIPRDARHALLKIDEQEIEIRLGELDPIETISGIQARLKNLGYDPGEIDGIDGPKTRAAVRAFQKECPPLVVDGICGPKTRAKLKEVHGC
jgi:N-acetylmuramoyl-L-alanine amidase